MRQAHLVLIVLASAAVSWAQAKKTVFMVTDAEGVAGICRQEQTDPTDTELRQLLTGEINAAVEGFLAGGADEVIVWDAHDGSRTLSALTIHPKAKLIIGSLGPTGLLERRYSALVFLGQHSMANVRAGIMAHSYSSLGIQNMRMNGKPVGEVETRVALAGWFGVPTILITGDRAAIEELRAIVPDAEVAEVKEGLARYSCISMSAPAARDLIREKARLSMQKIGKVKPYKIDGPVTIEIEYTTRNSLPIDANVRPGAEVVDDRTIRYHGKDFMEAWIRSRMY
ncbi:MAG TPA: M55 family metallopeptidase [Bryobacteraceae bacterium]|nr:M55 family metallopeptidase [Bryobacteraceae bacterium]